MTDESSIGREHYSIQSFPECWAIWKYSLWVVVKNRCSQRFSCCDMLCSVFYAHLERKRAVFCGTANRRLEHCFEWCKLGVYNKKRLDLFRSLGRVCPVSYCLIEWEENSLIIWIKYCWLCWLGQKEFFLVVAALAGKKVESMGVSQTHCSPSPQGRINPLKDIWEEAEWLRGAALHIFVS